MRKKAKKRPKVSESGVKDLSLMQKVKAYLKKKFEPFKLYVNQLPVVIACKKIKSRISEKLRLFILAFFDILAPCWNFFFLGKPKPNLDNS